MKIKISSSVIVMIVLLHSGGLSTEAQIEERKLEVGALYATIGLRAFDTTESGIGLRLSYNVNNHIAVEAEGNLFEQVLGGDHPTDDFLAAQGLLGIKTGVRNRWIGVFAKGRLGAANFPKLRIMRGLCFEVQSCGHSSRTGNRLAVDGGGVVEIYPTENIIIRIDVGDAIIRFKDDLFFRSSEFVRIRDGFSHNAQVAGGIGFRF